MYHSERTRPSPFGPSRPRRSSPLCCLLLTLLCGALLYAALPPLSPVPLLDGRPGGAAAAYLAEDIGEGALRLARSLGLTKLATSTCQNGNQLPHLLRALSAERAAQWAAAKAYYSRQRAHVLKSATEMEIHPYWRGVSNRSRGLSFESLVGESAEDMAAQLASDGREDFKIEKDKCAMYEWLAGQCLPIVPPLAVWRDSAHEAALGVEARLGSAGPWPLFLKMCHLTQGPEDSVRQLPSPKWTRERLGAVDTFLSSKWNHKAHDADRFLAPQMDRLTTTLSPGAMLQPGYSRPVELKVLVLWGRAYVAYLMGSISGVLTREGMFERGCRACCVQQIGLPAPLESVEELSWIKREAQLPRIWLLAETAAAAMGASQVRIDIFIRRGSPSELTINEISLHSGAPLHFHAEFAALLWTHAARHRPYPAERAWRERVAGSALHELKLFSSWVPNQLSLLRGLAEMKSWGANRSREISQCMKKAKSKAVLKAARAGR
ncbi:MAG: hypothetical protein SGPRY_006771 [Prymnesium sp.]